MLKLDKQGAASSTDGSNKAVSSAYTKSVILELPMLIPGQISLWEGTIITLYYYITLTTCLLAFYYFLVLTSFHGIIRVCKILKSIYSSCIVLDLTVVHFWRLTVLGMVTVRRLLSGVLVRALNVHILSIIPQNS